MRNATKRKGKHVLSALAAAGMSAWAGSAAHAINGSPATYTISVFNMGIQTVGSNSWQDWVVAATRTDLQGTGIDAIDVTIDTNGTANLGIDVEKISGLGANTKYDANIDGGTFDSAGVNAVLNQNTPAAPLFGDAVGGTFIGIGTSELNGNGSVPGFTTDITNNPFVTQAGATGVNSSGAGVIVSGKGLVFANGNVGTSNVDPYGPIGGMFLPSHGGITLSPTFTNTGGTSVNAGSTGNALLNGAVTKLEVIVTESDPGQIGTGNRGPIPFANIVVPAGTVFTVSGSIAPDSNGGASSSSFSIVIPAPVIQTGTLSISLTSTATNGANIGTVTMVGTNGGYLPGTASPTGGQQTTGNLSIKNGAGGDFNSNTHSQLIGLDESGATSLSQLESDLQNALQGTNAGATVGNAVNPILLANGDNVQITFPGASVPNTNPEALSYDLSNYAGAGNGTVTISQITVVPEPTAIGALAIGGLGLLSRRRRKARA